MGTKHKHYDVIVAYAMGEKVEVKCHGEWRLSPDPAFYTDLEYRIKPRLVKKEGWINVYGYGYTYGCTVWRSKEEADIKNDENSTKRIACICIEWKEEE